MNIKYYRHFLIVAYWNMYTDNLNVPEENGSHILPFMAMTSMFISFVGGWMVLLGIAIGFHLAEVIEPIVMLGLALGSCVTYVLFIKDKKFMRAKSVLSELDLFEQNSICTMCGLMTVIIGMSPIFMVLVLGLFMR